MGIAEDIDIVNEQRHVGEKQRTSLLQSSARLQELPGLIAHHDIHIKLIILLQIVCYLRSKMMHIDHHMTYTSTLHPLQHMP